MTSRGSSRLYLKYSAVVLLLLSSMGLLIAGWGFFTESGSRFALNRIQTLFVGIQYDYVSGNLATGLSLRNVTWKLKNNTTVSSKELTMTWDPWCWRGRHICIKQAHSDHLSINLTRSRVIRNPIRLKPVSMPSELSMDQLSIERLQINRPNQRPIELNNIEFSGNFHDSIIKADSLRGEWSNFTTDIEGTINLTDNYPLDARGTFSVFAAGEKTIAGYTTLSGDLLNTTVNADLALPFASQVKGTVSPLNRLFPVNLTAIWPEAGIPFQSAAPLYSIKKGQVNISGFRRDYTLTGKGMLDTPQLPHSEFDITGRITPANLHIENLSLFALNGVINAKGSIDFPTKLHNALSWNTELTLKELEPQSHWQVPLANVGGTALFSGHSSRDSKKLEFSGLNLTGRSGDQPFSLTGAVILDPNNVLTLNKLSLESSRNTVYANGILSDNSDLLLDFALREPDILNSELKGDISGNFIISGDSKAPDIAGVARSQQLIFNNLKAANTTFSAEIFAAGNEPGKLTITAGKISDSGKSIDELSLIIEGTRETHSLSTSFSGDDVRLSDTKISGSLDKQLNWDGVFLSAKGKVGVIPFHLLSPFDLAWSQFDKALTLKPNCWSFNVTYGCIDKPAKIGSEGDISFKLNGIDMRVFNTIYPEMLQTEGTVRSHGRLHWTAIGNPVFDVSARVGKGSLTTTLPSARRPLTLNLRNADLTIYSYGKKIRTNLKLNSDKTGDVTASALIDFAKPGNPMNGALSFEEIRIEQLNDYYSNVELDSGLLQADLSFKGSLDEPRVNGSVNLRDAAYMSNKLPLPLEAININADIVNNDINISGSAFSGGQQISISGLAYPDNHNWSMSLDLKGDDLNFKHQYIKSGVISPEISIAFKPGQTSISGNVALKDAYIDIPRLETTAVPLSNDIVIIDASDKQKQSRKKSAKQLITTDLNISLGRNVRFSGYGLNARLQGLTNIKMMPHRTPELLGTLDIHGGTYRSYGQALNIREGRISFVGPLEQAGLSVEAVRNTGSVLAGIRIAGTLEKPETTLFSEPPMPEEHILPYVVLGRPLDLSAKTDDSQLLANAALFMGISNGRRITKEIAANFGIENFSLNAMGSGDETQVQLSGRINDRLLVRYGLGVFNSVNTLFLRYDLAEKLYLETTQGLERAVDIFYSIEFD